MHRTAQPKPVVFHGIELVGNFMIGMPGETYEDYKSTLDLAGWMRRKDPIASIVGPHYYRIYPGGVLYNKIVSEYGFHSPDSFESWVSRYSDEENSGFQIGFADTGIVYP